MLRYTVLWIVLCFATTIQAQTPASFIDVKVVPKQNFYSLSRDYVIDVKTLKKYNEKYAPEYQLKIGDIVKIPVFSMAKSAAEVKPIVKSTASSEKTINPKSGKTHIIVKGESVYAIAKKYNVSIKDIKKWNNLDEEMKIKIGQELIVSDGAPTVSSVVAPKTSIKPQTVVAEKKENTPTLPKKIEEPAKEVIASDALYEPVTKIEETTPKKEEPKPAILESKPVEKTIAAKPIVEKVIPAETYSATTSSSEKMIMRGIGKVSMAPELTSSSFAYYNNANVGDIVKVVNLMSKRIFYMKVIGKIPKAEVDDETILIVSPDALKNLGSNDNRFLVEVSSK